MATPFTALGKGNGFSSCLAVINSSNDILNPPSLKQTMNAYWNFKSVSWGGASLEPENDPKNLICNPSANVGSNSNGSASANQGGRYRVATSLPGIYRVDGVNYYRHGISMSFVAQNTSSLEEGDQRSQISVSYLSTLYSKDSDLSAYECVNETFGPPPNPEIIGKLATEKIQDVSSVTISGIPFIKIVEKSFRGTLYNGSSGSCPVGDYPTVSGEPTLTLHT